VIIQRGRKGFTLIEMLIVLIIIAVLAVVVLPRIMNARRRAKDEATRQTKSQLETAVEEFEADIGCYPTALADLFTRVGATYSGVGVAGTATEAVSVSGADTLWRGPYFKGSYSATPPIGQGTWSLVTDTVATMGMVKITGVTGHAVDGSYYTAW